MQPAKLTRVKLTNNIYVLDFAVYESDNMFLIFLGNYNEYDKIIGLSHSNNKIVKVIHGNALRVKPDPEQLGIQS